MTLIFVPQPLGVGAFDPGSLTQGISSALLALTLILGLCGCNLDTGCAHSKERQPENHTLCENDVARLIARIRIQIELGQNALDEYEYARNQRNNDQVFLEIIIGVLATDLHSNLDLDAHQQADKYKCKHIVQNIAHTAFLLVPRFHALIIWMDADEAAKSTNHSKRPLIAT